MNIRGTLHLYSGGRDELFFVFDDDVAQLLYDMGEFDIDDKESRHVWVSVGTDRFIRRRTLSFSRKQTEIKVSLCSLGSKDGLGTLTELYEWFVPQDGHRPVPLPVLGSLKKSRHDGSAVWELSIMEPVDLVVPPGLGRRARKRSKEWEAWRHRREIQERELSVIGRSAEKLAWELAQVDFPQPKFACLWRDSFLDSEKEALRKLGVIADIDVWDTDNDTSACIIEVKAQKTTSPHDSPKFYLSGAEWRSFQVCSSQGIPYQLWLVQYRTREDLEGDQLHLNLIVYDKLAEEWLDNEENYIVKPIAKTGTHYSII